MSDDLHLQLFTDDELIRIFTSRLLHLDGLRERNESVGDVHGPVLRAARERYDAARAEVLRRMAL